MAGKRNAGRLQGEQLPLFRKRGGKRRGAGRPAKGKRSSEPHKRRPFLHARYPVHITLRVVREVGSLRRRRVYQAIREATLTTALRENFRIVQLSIQRTHVHLLVEADDQHALAAGMQGFQISAAKHLNAAISRNKPGPRRRGRVFPDRYHAEIITSPRQARHALSYVMINRRLTGQFAREARLTWMPSLSVSGCRALAARCASAGDARGCSTWRAFATSMRDRQAAGLDPTEYRVAA